jgi:hypothetical protein
MLLPLGNGLGLRGFVFVFVFVFGAGLCGFVSGHGVVRSIQWTFVPAVERWFSAATGMNG